MIKKIDTNFYLEINNQKYCFSGDDYEKLILFITNPNIQMPDTIKIDENIKSDEDKYKANVYKDFLEKFISSREKIDEEIKKENSDRTNEDIVVKNDNYSDF
jgi:hypothetical protein